jgi:hypothetical protein
MGWMDGWMEQACENAHPERDYRTLGGKSVEDAMALFSFLFFFYRRHARKSTRAATTEQLMDGRSEGKSVCERGEVDANHGIGSHGELGSIYYSFTCK